MTLEMRLFRPSRELGVVFFRIENITLKFRVRINIGNMRLCIIYKC